MSVAIIGVNVRPAACARRHVLAMLELVAEALNDTPVRFAGIPLPNTGGCARDRERTSRTVPVGGFAQVDKRL